MGEIAYPRVLPRYYRLCETERNASQLFHNPSDSTATILCSDSGILRGTSIHNSYLVVLIFSSSSHEAEAA